MLGAQVEIENGGIEIEITGHYHGFSSDSTGPTGSWPISASQSSSIIEISGSSSTIKIRAITASLNPRLFNALSLDCWSSDRIDFDGHAN